MSRGINLQLQRSSGSEGTTAYDVLASGWNPSDELAQVGVVKLNHESKSWEFIPLGAWEGEDFYQPAWEDLVHPGRESPSAAEYNPRYEMWNRLLLSGLRRILTEPAQRNGVSFQL